MEGMNCLRFGTLLCLFACVHGYAYFRWVSHFTHFNSNNTGAQDFRKKNGAKTKLTFEKKLIVEEAKWLSLDKDNIEMYRKSYENLRHISFAFRGRIPNGHKVPHPCNPTSDKWVAVGHMLSGGRGPRNPFGDDFAANGNVSDLCIFF